MCVICGFLGCGRLLAQLISLLIYSKLTYSRRLISAKYFVTLVAAFLHHVDLGIRKGMQSGIGKICITAIPLI